MRLALAVSLGNFIAQTTGVPEPWNFITQLGSAGIVAAILLYQHINDRKELKERQSRIDKLQDTIRTEVVPIVAQVNLTLAQNTGLMKALSDDVLREVREIRREMGK